MEIVNKGRLLKTFGWSTIGLGLYLVTLGYFHDTGEDNLYSNPKPPDDSIIDAEWFEVEE